MRLRGPPPGTRASVDAAFPATERGKPPGPDTAVRSCGHVGEEVSGASRRGPGRACVGDLGRQPQVGEDLADDPGFLDGGDQAHAAATARAGEDIDVERAPHQVGPRPVAGFAGSSATGLGDVWRAVEPAAGSAGKTFGASQATAQARSCGNEGRGRRGKGRD